MDLDRTHKTTKAVTCPKYGPPEVLRLTEVPKEATAAAYLEPSGSVFWADCQQRLRKGLQELLPAPRGPPS